MDNADLPIIQNGAQHSTKPGEKEEGFLHAGAEKGTSVHMHVHTGPVACPTSGAKSEKNE